MRKEFLSAYIIIALFIIFAIAQKNYEFIVYALVLVPFMGLLHYTDRWFQYKSFALWCIVAWMLMHFMGGLAMIGSERLYDFMLLRIVGEPYHILKYDQFVHVFCFFSMALLVGNVVLHGARNKASNWVLGIIITLAASGIGGINEIIEFSTVVFLNSTGVGGYTNTALDIVANLIGAVLGTVVFFRLKH
ncbi:DUF2238 domain-containing protein [Candidatus Woesearchaeota archaeon]|nr:DUF2238 domain-containing protein [Candidatus Woesearchaeota archaeon]